MALSCARPVGESGAALSAAFVERCRQIGNPRPVAAKLTSPVNHTSLTTLVATRSKCGHNCGSSSAPQLPRRRWPCRNGAWRRWKGLTSASASTTFSTESGADGRGEEGALPPLRVGIIGFGNFGQFIAKGIVRQGHEVIATSRTDYSSYCEENGIQFYRCMDAMCSGEKPLDVLLVCSSILSTEFLVRRIPFHLLSPDTVVADVLSVKQFPKNLFLEVLPLKMGILCTHPMFGPESGKNGWGSLPFVYDKVRVDANGESRQARNCERFLRIFEDEGCRMVEMSCEEHDRHAAGSQFITHTIGRILSHLDLESTPINTKGYETLLQLTENTVSDSFDLYYGLFMYNVNATEQMDNLDRAFETVKQKLFGRLHDILRKQLVERVPINNTNGTSTIAPTPTATSIAKAAAPATSSPSRATPIPSPFFLPSNSDMTDLSSFAISPATAPSTSAATSMAATKDK